MRDGSVAEIEALGGIGPVGAPAATVWGLTAAEVNDAYWESKGVRVVRPGEGSTGGAAGVYLLLNRGTSVVLHFRAVMDRMGWLRPELCMVRVGQEGGRCAFTADADLAAMWSRGEGRWAQLRSRAESGWCGMKAAGMMYRESDGQAFFEHVARVWEEPADRIAGVKRSGRGVWAMDGAPGATLPAGVTRVWVGRGRRVDEAHGKVGACVLGDATGAEM